ncbi:MFS transporter [Flindersiella endophytica]
MAILVGPLLFGALMVWASASLALDVIAMASAVGALGLSLVMRRTPPQRAGESGGKVLRNGDMRRLLVVIVMLGGAFGALEVGVPALASANNVPAASGVLVAITSVGGIVGALCYGSVKWGARPAVRLVFILLAAGLALIPAGFVTKLYVLAAVLFLVGAAFNQALTTASLIVDRLDVRRAEAFGWLSTALSAGAAVGAGLAGFTAEHTTAGRVFVAAAVFAALGVVLAVSLARRPECA